MAPKVDTATAKIYDFPVRSRAAAAALHASAKISSIPVPARPVRIEYGDCWYHEGAIAEADKPLKR